MGRLRSRRFFSLFQPLVPRNFFFPPSGPATGSINSLHPDNKFLAFHQR